MLAGACLAVQGSGKTGNGRLDEQIADRDRFAEHLAQARGHLHRHQRNTAQLEEVVMATDLFQLEQLFPEVGEGDLGLAFGRFVRQGFRLFVFDRRSDSRGMRRTRQRWRVVQHLANRLPSVAHHVLQNPCKQLHDGLRSGFVEQVAGVLQAAAQAFAGIHQ